MCVEDCNSNYRFDGQVYAPDGVTIDSSPRRCVDDCMDVTSDATKSYYKYYRDEGSMNCVLPKNCPTDEVADPSNGTGNAIDNGLCVVNCPTGWYSYDFGVDGKVCVQDCHATSVTEGHTPRFR